MKNHPEKIIIGLVIVVIILVYMYRRKSRIENINTSSDLPATPSSNTTTPVTVFDNNTVLKRGMNSSSATLNVIAYSQYELNKVATLKGFEKLSVDGAFGSKTETAFLKVLGKKTGSYAEVYNKVASLI